MRYARYQKCGRAAAWLIFLVDTCSSTTIRMVIMKRNWGIFLMQCATGHIPIKNLAQFSSFSHFLLHPVLLYEKKD